MKRIVLVFGMVIGLLFTANIGLMTYWMKHNPDMTGSEMVGYAIMVVVFSLIYFGTRNYRDKVLDGQISFGQALKTGTLIAVVGASFYVVAWLVCYYVFVPDFMDVYAAHALKNCSPAELAAKTQEMASFKEMYKNPLFVILMTYMEVLPIGLVVALVSALLLRTKNNVAGSTIS